MKNIWFINHYATSMYENEGGRHFWFAKQLVKQGNKVSIICSNQFHEKEETIDTENKLFKKESKDGIDFYFIKSINSTGNGIKRVLNMISFYQNLLRSYKKWIKYKITEKPDYIVGSSVHPLSMIAGIKMSKFFNIPSISEVRDLWPEAIFAFNKTKEKSVMGKLLVRGEKWIYEKSDAIIFTKEGDIDYIKEKKWNIESGGNIDLQKCFYINNGVNLEDFDLSLTQNKLEDEELLDSSFKVVYAGALRPVNNVSILVEAAKFLKNYSDLKILIYGQGIESNNLKELIKKNDLTNVKLKGFVDKKYIPFILSQSSLNILNYSQSQYNWTRGNSSNKLFEYMASGKPIISNVKMGYCLLENYNCGFVTEDNTPRALANEIIRIYKLSDNSYIKLCQNARNAASNFDFVVLTAKIEKVFKFASEGREYEKNH